MGNDQANSKPTVTVAMSILNGGAYLPLSVRSVLSQSFRDFELLIFDDGSTDGSYEYLSSLSDPRIKLVRDGTNKGLSTRLNQAIDMARGRYFARMDHDDISHPDRLAQQVACLDANDQVDLLATKCVTIDEDGTLLATLPFTSDHRQICARPWMGFPMPHPSWMGRTAWFRNHYYQDPGPYCCEDNELLLRAHAHSRYHALENELLAYRVRRWTPWRKMYETRKAMLAFQVRYFIRNRQWFSVALACGVTLARGMRDLKNQLVHRLGGGASEARLEGTGENEQWRKWFARLEP